MAAILDAILNISISPMMPRWHHSVSLYGHIGEHIYAKTFCADYFFGLHPKSSFGNLTIDSEEPLKCWIRVGQGPTALAVGAGGGCLDIFTLIYPFSSLSPSLWETTRYRLKYCLKGSLSPKTTTTTTTTVEMKIT